VVIFVFSSDIVGLLSASPHTMVTHLLVSSKITADRESSAAILHLTYECRSSVMTQDKRYDSRLAPVCTAIWVASELGRLNRLSQTGLRSAQTSTAPARLTRHVAFASSLGSGPFHRSFRSSSRYSDRSRRSRNSVGRTGKRPLEYNPYHRLKTVDPQEVYPGALEGED